MIKAHNTNYVQGNNAGTGQMVQSRRLLFLYYLGIYDFYRLATDAIHLPHPLY